MDNLINPKRKSIFQQFLYNKELRFNEIEKLTKIRSNELAYFIQKLVDDGILLKSGEFYKLTDLAEKYIPFFIEDDEKLSPLPVVLVSCVSSGKVLLWKRRKRPYKDQWSLPGGRIRLKETVEQASLRLLKDIAFIDAEFVSVNAVVNEKMVEADNIKHAFLILFTKAVPNNSIKENEDVRWFDIGSLPEKMIPSDKWLVQNRLESRIDFKEEIIRQHGDNLDIEFVQG